MRWTLVGAFGWVAGLVACLGIVGCGGEVTPPPGPHAVRGEDPGESHRHSQERVVRLEAGVADRLGLEMAVAGPGDLEVVVEVPGEVEVNGDRLAHVGPRVSGVARGVFVSLGDSVRAGQLLAIVDSRELADAKAAYLAARERTALAEATFLREQRLWQGRVSSEQDFLDAGNALAEARIELRSAQQKLYALGFDEGEVQRMAEEPDSEYTRYRITAPFSGEVIDRHITIGETISAQTPVFTVADLSTVWIDLQVYPKDLARVERGQRVHVVSAGDGVEGVGSVDFVQPLLGQDTRTALARVTMSNPGRRWKPGMFVTAAAVVETARVDVLVPRTSVIRMADGDDVVFVEMGGAFEARVVTLGRSAREHLEVVAGLAAGERYVAAGGFSLKAELGKGSFGDGHGH